MVKEKRILSYFIGWLLLGFIICFIGVNKIFALETTFKDLTVQGYDNNGTSLTVPAVFNCNEQGSCGMEITSSANSYGGAWAIQSPIPIISNHSYAITLRIRNTANVGIILSSKSRIALGNSLSSVKYNYEQGQYWNNEKYSKATGNYTLQYVITATGPASYLLIPFSTSTSITTNFMIDNIIIEDLGTESLTEDSINNSLNSQTNVLNNSIQNSTDTITGAIGDTENNINSNIDDMESAIVDSNKETQEVIKDQFNSCRPSKNLFKDDYIPLPNTNINTDILSAGVYTLSMVDKINLQGDNAIYIRLYKNGSIVTEPNHLIGENITFNFSTSSYNYYSVLSTPKNSLTFSLDSSYQLMIGMLNSNNNRQIMLVSGSTPNYNYERFGEVCSNKIDETNDKLDGVNDSINDLNSSLTDDSPTDMSGLGDSAGWLPAGPVDSILTLPLTLFTTLSDNLSNNTCTTAVLKLPFVNKNINLPCIKTLYDKIGITGTLFTTAGIIASCFILFNYLLSLYNWIDKTLTMRENTMPGYYDDNWGGGA